MYATMTNLNNLHLSNVYDVRSSGGLNSINVESQHDSESHVILSGKNQKHKRTATAKTAILIHDDKFESRKNVRGSLVSTADEDHQFYKAANTSKPKLAEISQTNIIASDSLRYLGDNDQTSNNISSK